MIIDKIKSIFSFGSAKGKSGGKIEGVVTKVIYKKGFGFIQRNDNKEKVFIHFKDAPGKIKVGDKLKFKIVQADKGPRAAEVEKLN